eukprot:10488034-Alexandrium_andersonii.AAC.1
MGHVAFGGGRSDLYAVDGAFVRMSHRTSAKGHTKVALRLRSQVPTGPSSGNTKQRSLTSQAF